MATHSSVFAWEIPWTEEPGKLQVHEVAKESDTTQWLKQENYFLYPYAFSNYLERPVNEEYDIRTFL